MTSEDRHKARFNRRVEKRNKAKREFLKEHGNFDLITNADTLYDAFRDSKRGVAWKESVQKYDMNLFDNIFKTRERLLNGESIQKGFYEFDIMERGKPRHIRSVHISERVVQRALCKNILAPVLTRSLIYDNSATLKGKGISFAIKRLKKQLTQHYRKFGNEGYVLLIDFKSYFDNIDHKCIERILRKHFTDERVINLTMDFVHAFGEKGLGLGSEVSQILAVAYLNEIDHFIKEELRIKGYGRYMDDSYFIHQDKEYLKRCLEILKKKYAEFGVVINEKKTRIVKLSRGFTFLKTKFVYNQNGKILLLPIRENITRERRKLKKLHKMFRNKSINFPLICNSYISWRGFIETKNAHRVIVTMDRLFFSLFRNEVIREILNSKPGKKKILLKISLNSNFDWSCLNNERIVVTQ